MSHMNFSPLKVSLFTGVASSSYFFFGNLGASSFGIIPAIRDEDGADISVAQKLALQDWHYNVAKWHMGGAGGVASLSLTLAGYLSRSRCMRNIMLSTAALAFLITPWTLITMMPVNKEIADIVNTRALEVAPGAEKSPDQSLLEKRAMQKINTWRKLHAMRIVMGAGVWIGGLVAFSYGV